MPSTSRPSPSQPACGPLRPSRDAFSRSSDPLFRATGPNNNPHPRPHIPFRPPWPGFLAFQGDRAVLETLPAPIRRPYGPPQAKVQAAPANQEGPPPPSRNSSGRREAPRTAQDFPPHRPPTTTSESSPITRDNPPRPARNTPARQRTTPTPRAKRRRGPQDPAQIINLKAPQRGAETNYRLRCY